MSTAIAIQPNTTMTPERERLLRDLVMKGASNDQVQLAVVICNRYGFDPLLKHIVFIGGNLYVTRDGLLDNAHRSGRFDGIEVTAERDKDGKWSATATVWVKGMSHPIRYTAYQPEHESSQSAAWKKSPRAMTVKCAEVMALKRAFNISLGTAEEIGQDDEAIDADHVMVSDEATPRQIRYLHAVARELNLSHDDLHAMSMQHFGAGIAELSRRDISAFIEQLQETRSTRPVTEILSDSISGPVDPETGEILPPSSSEGFVPEPRDEILASLREVTDRRDLAAIKVQIRELRLHEDEVVTEAYRKAFERLQQPAMAGA
jgi:hypothetical protein